MNKYPACKEFYPLCKELMVYRILNVTHTVGLSGRIQSEISIFKIFIWRGILLYIPLEIKFYSDAGYTDRNLVLL